MDFGKILDAWDAQCARKGNQPRKDQSAPGNSRGGGGVQSGDSVQGGGNVQRGGDAKDKGRTTPPTIDPITEWIRKNGVYDKDKELEAEQSPAMRRRMLLAKKPDGVLDLHGLRRDEAWLALENFFRHGRNQGFQKLLIIHGKGNHSEGEAILKRTVRQFIEVCPFAGESGASNTKSGGTGSTWVLLKDQGAIIPTVRGK
jgi:DNA-nicking Smr family endonuclease